MSCPDIAACGIMTKIGWQWLGHFTTLEQAVKVRKDAEEKHYAGA